MHRLLLFCGWLDIAFTHGQLIDCLQLCLIGAHKVSPVIDGDVAADYLLAVIAVASTGLRLASSDQHFSIAREI